MNSFNRVILLGNLTRDPQVSSLPRGTACATFAIALNKKYKGENGQTVETVSYIDIVAYGKPAENAGKYLHKGDPVHIEGELRQRRWDDKDTGAKRSKVEVVAGPMGITYMPKGQGAGGPGGGEVPHNVGQSALSTVEGVFPDAQPVPDDEIPF